MTRALVATVGTLLGSVGCSRAPEPVDMRPSVVTQAVGDDPDDPAIWINPANPAASLIVGTNKVAAPHGALVVFGLDGKIRQMVAGLDRPNNVDIEYGLALSSGPVDIVVATERLRQQLRIFNVSSAGISEISAGGGLPVFAGEPAESAAPMGIALYRRPRDGAVFAIVSRKTGPRVGYLWQYRLFDDGSGKVTGQKVREFGGFSGVGEIEAIAIDDELGYVYYADEGDGIHKWHADPDHPDAGRELAHFGRQGFAGDREGIAIYARRNGTGYILCTDQVPRNSAYHVYSREGKPGSPHDHSELLKVVRGGADETDGLDATSVNLGPQFPNGLLIAMNSSGRNFFLYRWEDVANALSPRLAIGRE